MARHLFGGDISGWTFTEGAAGEAVLAGGVAVTFYSAETGGELYDDLTDLEGTPITSVTSSDGTDGRAKGQIPPCYGPDGVWWMWAEAGEGGPRARVMSQDMGEAIDAVTALAAEVNAGLAAHLAQANGHGTAVADLTDVSVGTAESRTGGTVLGWDGVDQRFELLTPSQIAGAVLLDPPDVAGAYVGNVAEPPDPAQGSGGNPWLSMQQPYSSGDNNPDGVVFWSTTSGGTRIKTAWFNGNNEFRGAPSANNRIGGRFFEFAESLGGPSTGRFFELSTNPSLSANREPLLGAYGTGHATQPGWVVATRVLGGLLGVRAGGSYNSLSAVNVRGVRASTGAPDSGTWVTNDLVIDSAGVVWLCTAGGTPGTWSAAGPAPTALAGANGVTAVNLGARLVNGGKSVELAGRAANSTGGTLASGTTLFTLPAEMTPPHQAKINIRYTGGGNVLTVETTGEASLGTGLNTGQEVFLDGVGFVRTWL